MEEWLPVTKLVALRRPTKNWRIRGSAVVALLAFLLLGRFFGPTVLEGWREMAQYEFTERAAYWKAREAVRREALPAGALVEVGNFASAQVVMDGASRRATVQLPGEVTGPDGKATARKWEVTLSYRPQLKQWMARDIQKK